MTVTRADLEDRIEQLRAAVRDPRAGLYGPGSVSWRVNREGIVMLGGGRAALLQLAHPYVAHGVDQHSATRTDPIGRFQRTFANVFAMVFGDLDHAIESARRVHRIHSQIRGAIREDVGAYQRGHRYHANDPAALFWVQATLVDTAIQVYELTVAKLSTAEKERYYEESRLFGWLFGIPDSAVPEGWSRFQEYMRDMMASDTITVGAVALELKEFLLKPPGRIQAPAFAWLEVFTAGLLPPRLRAQFGFAWGRREEAIFARTVPMLRAAYRAAPRRVRLFPAYVEARRRIAGQPERDPFGRLLERLAMKAIEPKPVATGAEPARARR